LIHGFINGGHGPVEPGTVERCASRESTNPQSPRLPDLANQTGSLGGVSPEAKRVTTQLTKSWIEMLE
jgi:hypothetical protein